ncbi:MAG: hypothetical protein R3267_06020 [Paenisporosarcina sp.]|nr:hypothetical protein [Paenisporosarcina sp.]
MSTIPDINIIRETAEGIANEHRNNFAESDFFKKMCSDIQEKANKGEFVTSFNANINFNHKDVLSAKNLFEQHGYQTQLVRSALIVSWGRDYTETEE